MGGRRGREENKRSEKNQLVENGSSNVDSFSKIFSIFTKDIGVIVRGG